ncbi:TetR/AcrR family transcriptional regulator [Nocardioides humilatus]|uniref:TetR/AcrR family transcriptional regulator n=1 Tax=Nocardioides humilatus TaxID=2607660 RepID=A0A5B1LPE6_9ACTN|nr:TetR/AcrR family transcriptional regulator [Nocardioides humilatus]KAA1421650.1 TetR/AcrR family transcriptional regulator [Nocardioides humilatus]
MTTGRTYGGESAEDRATRRRIQLLNAGLELFGTAGYRQATVRQICREAGITDRYFYEQFASTEDLLIAVYDVCVDRLAQAAVIAVGESEGGVVQIARAGLDALLGVVEDDPRLARVVWFEVLGVSARVEQRYLSQMTTFGELVVSLLGDRESLREIGETELRILADAAVGGISHAVVSWTVSDFQPPRVRLVESLATFLGGAASAFLQA